MGFFDDLFGGFFDFNGDGKTDVGEQFIALNMMGAFDDDEDDTDSAFDDDFDDIDDDF
jgi:hypothetical protein